MKYPTAGLAAIGRFFRSAVRGLRGRAFGEANPMMTSSRPPAWIVLASMLVGLPACAAKSSSPMMSDVAYAEEAYGGDYDDYGGEAEYDMAAEAPAPEPQSMTTISADSRSERKRVLGRRSRSKAKESAKAGNVMASPAATEPPGGSSDAGASPGDAEPHKADEQPPEADEGRHIIYTAGMRIAVFNLADAIATAESLPERHGGYVQSMTNSQVVLRIPSKNLRSVMSSLAGYGNVEQRWLNSQDVTAEYTDLESRLKALEKTHTQLLELLGKARTVEEALKVREALDRVAAELEVLKGRLRQLDNMTTYSTLTLDFYERGPHTPTPSSNDPFPWVDGLGVENTEWK